MELLLVGVGALNIYAAVLILLRAAIYRTRLYRPMLWNITLSLMPILILVAGLVSWSVLISGVGELLAYIVLCAFALVWLLMLPNASYLITELNLSHRREADAVPLWYDIILVITLAMSGVANTVINVFIAHSAYLTVLRTDADSYTRADSIVAVVLVMLVLGFGMYLGRYLRLNSWDVRHPAGFARKVVTHFRDPVHVWASLGFTVTYAIFLAIMYLMVIGPIIEVQWLSENLFSRIGVSH